MGRREEAEKIVALARMKPRFFISLLIFLSAYAPLALIVAAKDFDWDRHAFAHLQGSWACLGLGFLSLIVLKSTMEAFRGQHPVEIKSVKGRSGDLINYSIPYLVTFVTVDKFFELSNLVPFGLFMALMFLLTLKTQSLFINPLLAAMGYGLYDVEFQEGEVEKAGVFLVKGEIRPKMPVRMVRLSQFLYLATGQLTDGDEL